MTKDTERAARALAARDYDRDIWDELLENEAEWDRLHTEGTPTGVREEYREQVRSVIDSVLLDPSEEVVKATRESFREGGLPPTRDEVRAALRAAGQAITALRAAGQAITAPSAETRMSPTEEYAVVGRLNARSPGHRVTYTVAQLASLLDGIDDAGYRRGYEAGLASLAEDLMPDGSTTA